METSLFIGILLLPVLAWLMARSWQNDSAADYPRSRVFRLFVLLGGGVGFMALAGLTFMFNVITQGWKPTMGETGWWPIVGTLVFRGASTFVLGTVFGCIPAGLCGAWLAWWKVPRTKLGILHAVAAGAVIGGVSVFVGFDGRAEQFWMGAANGALAAAILSGWVLPKPMDKPNSRVGALR